MDPLPLYVQCIRRAYCLPMGWASAPFNRSGSCVICHGSRSDHPGRKGFFPRCVAGSGTRYGFSPRQTGITGSYDTWPAPTASDLLTVRLLFDLLSPRALLHLPERFFLHFGGNPDKPIAWGVSSYDKWYNLLWFNNGYHAGHHFRPKLHWTKMKQFHEEIAEAQRREGVRAIRPSHALGFLDPNLPPRKHWNRRNAPAPQQPSETT
jgi:hypothetical protein